MITVRMDRSQSKALKRSLEGTKKKLPRETATVINKTTTQAVTLIGKEIRGEVTAKAKPVKKSLKKGTRATPDKLGSSVTIRKTSRLSLKEFAPRETKKGVTYKISKKGGRKLIRGGFTNATLNWHIFSRIRKSRTPIYKLWGPSPWGVFVKHKMREPTVKTIQGAFIKQLNKRIRDNVLKQSGLI